MYRTRLKKSYWPIFKIKDNNLSSTKYSEPINNTILEIVEDKNINEHNNKLPPNEDISNLAVQENKRIDLMNNISDLNLASETTNKVTSKFNVTPNITNTTSVTPKKSIIFKIFLDRGDINDIDHHKVSSEILLKRTQLNIDIPIDLQKQMIRNKTIMLVDFIWNKTILIFDAKLLVIMNLKKELTK